MGGTEELMQKGTQGQDRNDMMSAANLQAAQFNFNQGGNM